MPRPRALLTLPLLALVLSGCVPTPAPTPEPGASTRPPTSTAIPTPTPTVTITSAPVPETEPVTIGCSDLLSLQTIYDYNPNVSLLTDFSPDPASLAGEALAQQGLACGLVNQTSGATIAVGVVRFSDAAYASKLTAVSASSTPASGFDGFFDSTGGVGVAQAFSAPYWITIASAVFLEGADAAPLVSAVLAGLG